MANIELTTASLATRRSIANTLPHPQILGKLVYTGDEYGIFLPAGGALKVLTYDTQNVQQNCVVRPNYIETTLEDTYRMYGMVSFFANSNHLIQLQLRIDDQLVCGCNPEVETNANDEINLTTYEVTQVNPGQEISLYLESDTDVNLTVKKTKLLIHN